MQRVAPPCGRAAGLRPGRTGHRRRASGPGPPARGAQTTQPQASDPVDPPRRNGSTPRPGGSAHRDGPIPAPAPGRPASAAGRKEAPGPKAHRTSAGHRPPPRRPCRRPAGRPGLPPAAHRRPSRRCLSPAPPRPARILPQPPAGTGQELVRESPVQEHLRPRRSWPAARTHRGARRRTATASWICRSPPHPRPARPGAVRTVRPATPPRGPSAHQCGRRNRPPQQYGHLRRIAAGP